jgi:nucleotide-binding universal stress UspA family protein
MERIVVGVDGSAGGEAALRWALDEAGLHDAVVVAAMAWTYLDQRHAGKSEAFDPAYTDEQAREALRAAVDAVVPPRPVEQRVILDLPAQALLDAGADADLIVVGARGLGGFKGLLLGSVSERVLEHATGPVAVVHKEHIGRPGGPVVVGIDGSPTSMTALHWAAREAEARKASLRVVHTWQLPPLAGPPTGELAGLLEEAAQSVLDEAVEDPALAGVEVESRLEYGGSVHALIELAADAALVVVGSRGLGRFERVLLGSTSRQLVHHAPCPTVVTPPADHA